MFCILIIVIVTFVAFSLVLTILVINLILVILYEIQLSYSFIYLFIQSAFKNIKSSPRAGPFRGYDNEQGNTASALESFQAPDGPLCFW